MNITSEPALALNYHVHLEYFVYRTSELFENSLGYYLKQRTVDYLAVLVKWCPFQTHGPLPNGSVSRK